MVKRTVLTQLGIKLADTRYIKFLLYDLVDKLEVLENEFFIMRCLRSVFSILIYDLSSYENDLLNVRLIELNVLEAGEVNIFIFLYVSD